jgi:hypothetical protein
MPKQLQFYLTDRTKSESKALESADSIAATADLFVVMEPHRKTLALAQAGVTALAHICGRLVEVEVKGLAKSPAGLKIHKSWTFNGFGAPPG